MILNRRRLLKATAIGTVATVTSPLIIRDLHAQDIIKIAGIHDTSGGLDTYGKPMVATTLAVKEINAAGGVLGRKIRCPVRTQSNIALYTKYASRRATRRSRSSMAASPRRRARPSGRFRRVNILYFYNMLYEGGVCDRNSPSPERRRRRPSEAGVIRAEEWGKKVYASPPTTTTARSLQSGSPNTSRQRRRVVQTDFFPLDVADFGSTIDKIRQPSPTRLRRWSARAPLVLPPVGGGGMNKQIPLASTTFVGTRTSCTSPEEHDGIVVAGNYSKEATRRRTRSSSRWGKQVRRHEDVPRSPPRRTRGSSCGPRRQEGRQLDRKKVMKALEPTPRTTGRRASQDGSADPSCDPRHRYRKSRARSW